MMQNRTFFFQSSFTHHGRHPSSVSRRYHLLWIRLFGPACIAFTSTCSTDGYLWRAPRRTFKFPIANPIFLNGCFYCLDHQINLGMFRPNDDEDGISDKSNNNNEEDEARALGCSFRLIETPEWIKARTDFDIDGYGHKNRLFLIESNGELFAVVLDDVKETITVYGVHPDKRRWTLVDHLGDRIFFVGALSCISAEGTAVAKS